MKEMNKELCPNQSSQQMLTTGICLQLLHSASFCNKWSTLTPDTTDRKHGKQYNCVKGRKLAVS